MGVFLWGNYWSNPGDSFSDTPPQNVKFRDVLIKDVLDLQGDILYQGKSWISYTPSVSISLISGYGATLTLSSNTISGKYRRLSDDFVFFVISGNLVFSTGTGQALAILGLPPLAPSSPFVASGGFLGVSSLSPTPISVGLIGYVNPTDTTVTLTPIPLVDGSAVNGINSYAPSARTVIITISGIYETSS